MSVTSHDVARLAGVSQPTVSRALRDDPRVSPATKDRVMAAAQALGYVPSELGRSLSTRATRQIAMVADLDNPLYPQLVPPIYDELSRLGYRMVLLAERGEGIHDRLLDGSVDGAILTTTLLKSALPYELTRRRLPLVYLNRVSDQVDADSATADNYDGAAQAAKLLIERGHRDIGAILGPPELSTARDREAGFRSVLEDAGLTLPPRWVYRGTFAYRQGSEGLKALMAGKNRPTAIFCLNDVIAVGALNAALEAGIRIPDDLAIVGFDDLEMASWPPYQLTTVHNPLAAMAKAAARLLVERIQDDGSAEPRHEVFPTVLVLRRTHGG